MCASVGASGVLTVFLFQHMSWDDDWYELAAGLVTTAILAGVLFLALSHIVNEFMVCDAALRRLTLALMVSSAVIVALLVPVGPCTLTWKWAAGPQSGDAAPVFFGMSWDSVERRVIELHATNDPAGTPYGVWRAVASFDKAGVQPAQVDLWLTQPSWAVIDATTGRPPPTADGVDVVVYVQRGQNRLLERRVALDPPATPEQGSWHHVTLNLPPGAERLVVEVHMRSTLDSDRVWITEAAVEPTRTAVVDQVALALIVVLSASALAFAGRIPFITSMARHALAFLSNYGYLLLGAACLWLGYLLVWQRGFFLDDWSVGLAARDPQTLEWLPIEFTSRAIPTFPARVLTFVVIPRLIALMWTNEFLVRLLITVCVGLNAFLLGWLVYRMLHLRLPAIVAGWLFLMPIYTDVTLWAGAVAYVFMTGLTLLMLHVIWSALIDDNPRYIWLLVGSLMLITLMWVEATIGIIGIIPIMGILYRVQQPKIKWRTIAYRTTLGVIVPTIVIVLFIFLVIIRSRLVAQRGGITTDITLIAQRTNDWLKTLYWYILEPKWGHRFTEASYIVGSNHILTSLPGIILLSGISIILSLTVINWRSDQIRLSNVIPALFMLVFGFGWFLTTLFVPYLFVAQQIFERRFLYFPLAGLSIAFGSLVALTTSIIRCRGLQQALLAVFGVLLIMLSLCMVGYARMYKVRYETDVKAFASLGYLVPAEAIPERTQFIPVNLDYSLPGQENLLTGLVVSAFESRWTAYAGLDPVYPNKNIKYITSSRWIPVNFSEHPSANLNVLVCNRYEQNPQTTALKAATLFVQGCPIDSARAIVFTSRSGELTLVRTLTLQRSDGTTRIVELPVVSRLAARGSTVIETLVVPVKD
jgi:hypothetical protein